MLNLVHQKEEQLSLLVPDHLDVPLQIRVLRILEISSKTTIEKETDLLLEIGHSITKIKELVEEKFEDIDSILQNFSPPKETFDAWEELNFWLDVWEGDCPTFWQQVELKTEGVDPNLIMMINDRLNFEFFLSKLTHNLNTLDSYLDNLVDKIVESLKP